MVENTQTDLNRRYFCCYLDAGGFNRTYSPANFGCRKMNSCHSFSGSCSLRSSMNGKLGTAEAAEVGIIKVAEVPKNKYD